MKKDDGGISFLVLLLMVIMTTAPCMKVFAQKHAFLSGVITDTAGVPVEGVTVAIPNTGWMTSSNAQGHYRLKTPYDQLFTVTFGHTSYSMQFAEFTLKPNEEKQYDVQLLPGSTTLKVYNVTAEAGDEGGLRKIPVKAAGNIPSLSGNAIEELIKRTGMGVYSRNELSSQYSVRGGNYDENMVYVNGIEVIRPLLVRSGQQEGLSFVNADLTQSVWFSAGGFGARYGDKMSSVLDATYRRPDAFAGSAELSLQGATLSVQDISHDKNLTWLLGVRQKSNRYVLGSLETSGDYRPSFTDIQTYVTYLLPDKRSTVSFLGNYARNRYAFTPESRETRFGTWNEVLRLKVYFEGQEVDMFESGFGALDFTWRPADSLTFSLVFSAFRSNEYETFDILGQYWLDELNINLGSDEFGDVAFNRGVGTFLNHARNYLESDIVNAELRGQYTTRKNFLWEWGVKLQQEVISDRLLEWYLIDSAGYNLPHPPDSVGYTDPTAQPDPDLELSEYLNSDIDLNTHRVTAYVQNTWKSRSQPGKPYVMLNTGLRANYWDYSGELLVSPRVTLTLKPGRRTNLLYRFSAGLYYQPPFYREMRDLDGTLNEQIKAQQSTHFVAGAEWDLRFWQRPFKFVGEVYYKDMKNLIPYEFDNIRVRYFSSLTAKGYAMGMDLKLNGELVPGIESWAGVSLMSTKENIDGDYYFDYYNQYDSLIIWDQTVDKEIAYSVKRYAGYKPRPTDQLINFNLFFQDYLPSVPDLKAHLNLVWGSKIPFGKPKTKNYKYPGRSAAYRRVDVGFSKVVFTHGKGPSKHFPFRYLDKIWISLEVFNLLQFSNTLGYTWITDVNNQQYAIPSRLTPRQINFKIKFDF
ncbi:MAG TPA: carboxypeptidase-like regulatory domain-containing protein [Bacteroidales bacterium]|nr:carboxypeptidase-like regulatory domain-containing protein [Bacteroidales bacterium]